MLKNIAAVKPMKESEINDLGVNELEVLCEDLVPSNLFDGETVEVDGHAADLQSYDGLGDDHGHADCELEPSAPRRKRQKKQYDLSAVRRSVRVRARNKFHDEK